MVRLKIRAFASALAAVTLLSGCIDEGPRLADRQRFDSEYGAPALPNRDTFVGTIYFATGSAKLGKPALADLVRMADRINDRRHGAHNVVLVGYADRRRGVQENSELAAERAQQVAIALEKRGVQFDRIVLDARRLRSENNRPGERRVDIYLDGKKGTEARVFYPILVAVFLLTTFIVGVLVFRRR